jgi:ribonuclease Z
MAVRDIQPVNVDHSLDSHAVSFTFADGFKFSYSGDCRPSREFARTGMDSTVLVHEATLENALSHYARVKKHCTVSEALSVAREMNAKRVILTHFSQRYPKLPLLDEIYGPDLSAAEVPATTPSIAPALAPALDNIAQTDADGGGVAVPVPQRIGAARQPLSSPLPPPLPSPGEERPRSASPVAPGMKVAVAFDLMRIKVGEIIEFEHYVPALRKLFPSEDEGDANSAAPIPELTDEGIADVSAGVADEIPGQPATEGSH